MSGERVKVALRTLGCKVNQVESEDIAADLLARGVSIVPEPDADVIVVNTCTVTGEADAKARKAVRHALRASTSATVVVTGCMAAVSRDDLEALGPRVIVEADKSSVAERVAEALGVCADVSLVRGRAPKAGTGFRTRAMLKVQDGCDAFCSYCIVPHARGAPVSVGLDSVEAQAAALVREGVREVVLTGVNLGRYDDGGQDLADVVTAVAGTGVQRVRLSSLEPVHLTDRLLGVLSSLPAVCPHLHVPLQSGSDAVLAAMGRPYTARQYVRAIGAARDAIPGLALTTDVIAGFPGEREEDARATLALCEQEEFSRLHVFRYSERSGTAAAEMSEKVSATQRGRRAGELRALSRRLEERFATAHLGERVEVLVERVDGGGPSAAAVGTTRDYLRVAVTDLDAVKVGELVGAYIVDASTRPVTGRMARSQPAHREGDG